MFEKRGEKNNIQIYDKTIKPDNKAIVKQNNESRKYNQPHPHLFPFLLTIQMGLKLPANIYRFLCVLSLSYLNKYAVQTKSRFHQKAKLRNKTKKKTEKQQKPKARLRAKFYHNTPSATEMSCGKCNICSIYRRKSISTNGDVKLTKWIK